MLNRVSRFVPVADMPRVMGLISSAQTVAQIVFLNLGSWSWNYGPHLTQLLVWCAFTLTAWNTFVAFNKDEDEKAFDVASSSAPIQWTKWLHPFMLWAVAAYVMSFASSEWSAPVYWPRLMSFGISSQTISIVRSVNIMWNVVVHLYLGIHLSGKGPRTLLRWACIGVCFIGIAFITEGPHPVVQQFVELVTPLQGQAAMLCLSLGLTNLLFVFGQALLAVTVLPLMRQLLCDSNGNDSWTSNTLLPGVYLGCQSIGAGTGAMLGGKMADVMGFVPACSAMAVGFLGFAALGLLVQPPASILSSKKAAYASTV
eukprot:gnl/MRDRNA2_/MRDRNA2_69175_c0_seq1.p1 gnl/MRDRNA2_/MRDRNA2_69175_c0~~gnl/MRDRNA2_/MRDRNA2_69175_c0_seq1.p1  ORF type:complete len:313 (+),score=35.64 gnl/MRDRNA2_/MRDRNA2_69175_c0_seq1:109-1047(+)